MVFDNNSREHLFDNPSELQKIFIKRRSFRKYMKKPVEKEKILNIQKTCDIFIEKSGFCHSIIHITEVADEFNRIVDSATKGFLGKVNPWLKKTDADRLILAMADMTGINTDSERLKIIAETSILMQIAILRATELGLATCWMTGVNLS
ncbi:MAG: nitroreductase family protein, partial [Myxococcota bacterium]